MTVNFVKVNPGVFSTKIAATKPSDRPIKNLFIHRLHHLEEKARETYAFGNKKPSVLILGAGPAGLIRALESMLSGNPTLVMEKRSMGKEPRQNSVFMDHSSYEILSRYGVYEYLLKEKLIYPYDPVARTFSVKIGDLEKALHEVITLLVPGQKWLYHDHELEKVEQMQDGTTLVRLRDCKTQVVDMTLSPNVVVVAEGAHSKTLAKIGAERKDSVAKLPLIGAIFKKAISAQPEQAEPLYKRVIVSWQNCKTKVYYFALFLFLYCFAGERFHNPQRKILIAIPVVTPGQTFISYELCREEVDKIKEKQVRVAELKRQSMTSPELERQLQEAENDLAKTLEHWSYLAAVFSFFLGIKLYLQGKKAKDQIPSFMPIDPRSLFLIDSGADKASLAAKTIGTTHFLVCGDTFATTHPITGQGVNIAIRTSKCFASFLSSLSNKNLPAALSAYETSMHSEADYGQIQTKMLLSRYHPELTSSLVKIE